MEVRRDINGRVWVKAIRNINKRRICFQVVFKSHFSWFSELEMDRCNPFLSCLSPPPPWWLCNALLACCKIQPQVKGPTIIPVHIHANVASIQLLLSVCSAIYNLCCIVKLTKCISNIFKMSWANRLTLYVLTVYKPCNLKYIYSP